MTQPMVPMVMVFAFVGENHLAMGKRARGRQTGKRSTVTGHVEGHDDNLKLTARRELSEEFGISVDSERFIFIDEFTEQLHKLFHVTVFVVHLTEEEFLSGEAGDDMADLHLIHVDEMEELNKAGEIAYTQGDLFREYTLRFFSKERR